MLDKLTAHHKQLAVIGAIASVLGVYLYLSGKHSTPSLATDGTSTGSGGGTGTSGDNTDIQDILDRLKDLENTKDTGVDISWNIDQGLDFLQNIEGSDAYSFGSSGISVGSSGGGGTISIGGLNIGGSGSSSHSTSSSHNVSGYSTYDRTYEGTFGGASEGSIKGNFTPEQITAIIDEISGSYNDRHQAILDYTAWLTQYQHDAGAGIDNQRSRLGVDPGKVFSHA